MEVVKYVREMEPISLLWLGSSAFLFMSNFYTSFRKKNEQDTMDRLIYSAGKSFFMGNPFLALPRLAYGALKSACYNDWKFLAPMFYYQSTFDKEFHNYCFMNRVMPKAE